MHTTWHMKQSNFFNGDTPVIDDKAITEILQMPIEDLGGGVVRFPHAINIDRELVTSWIDQNSQKAHEQRWTYKTDDHGNMYAINEDGNKFSLEQIEEVPVRVLEPVKVETDPDMVSTFRLWEDMVYKCLIKYVHMFPMVLGTIWWRNRGHVIRYDKGDYLGIHNDNDSNYRATNGKRYIPKGQLQMRQVVAALVYINDCVDTEEFDGTNYVGGELFFPYLGINTKPKQGDVFIFPTNYIATHGVNTVIEGRRYCYLEFFSQGNSHEEVLVSVTEPNECDTWCRAHWIDNLYDDYQRYCLSAEYGEVNFDGKPNPVFQNRSLEGEEGHKKVYNHNKVFEDNNNRGKIKTLNN